MQTQSASVCDHFLGFLCDFVAWAFTDRVLYTPERLAKIAAEAAKEDSVFSLNDRIGLVFDSLALSKAGLAKLSSSLTLIDLLKNEKECKLGSVDAHVANLAF